MRHNKGLGFFECGNCSFATDGRKIVEEIIKLLPALQIIK